MATNCEELLQRQKLCYENIKQIGINFAKDSAYRKTTEYLEKRLLALEAHWSEFKSNHEILTPIVDPECDYVTENIYVKTKTYFETTKQKLLTEKIMLAARTPTRGPTPSGSRQEDFPMEDIHSRKGNAAAVADGDSKLLRQQILNFSAFERTVSKIDTSVLEDKWELEDSLAMLKTRWEAIDKIHWELDYLLADSESTYASEYSKWESVHDTLKREINKKIWADTHRQTSTPKVEIPEFHGNYNKWVSFRDLYMETVHSSKWLTKSQKMQLLKTKLKGEPEKLVQHLTISADNYDSCWDILCNRYENKRLLCSSFINAILGLPNIQVAAASNLKKMHDTINECINGLTNIGIDVSTWDPIIVHLLLPKLDTATYADYIHDLLACNLF